MKKVLIISSSPRKGGNSDSLCREFERGALEAGHQVEYVRLAEKNIGYCTGCYACHKMGKCFQDDDMNELQQSLLNADVLVLATPVYFYSMSAQLKTFVDRMTPFYEEVRSDIYLFATAWDPNTQNLESTLEAMRGLTRDCFEGCEEKGALAVGDVSSLGEIKGRKELEIAYNWGKNC